ncbi:alpha/beta hydrolase [Acidimangrovimonas sediminis]|uniref:alpha/beta hydrolase n=1 Tax=Acidimangrovimonas sediminis TaxID=2056283 RepID=UPI000C8049D7|nr:alpha/beta hydrolase [Acidimangrovimonas sediminis]
MSAEMDRAYANGDFIPGAADFPPRWAEKAEIFRTALGARARLGLPYGDGARNWFDLFLPDGAGGAAARGLMVFIHGGYWMRFSPRDFSHLAAGALARGFACAMPAYTLAPGARIGEMTAEIGAAIAAAGAEVDGPIAVTGHSAGGHLSARMACAGAPLSPALAGRVQRAVPISPLADLRPLMDTTMNETLALDLPEALAESPALTPRRADCAVTVWVGGQERPSFLWQARSLSEAWDCDWHVAPGLHHFDVIDDLEAEDSALTEAVLGGL